MKKLSNGFLNAITAVILSFIVVMISCLCFIPDQVVVISGGESYSPLYNGDRNQNNVALMFNVYEGREVVEGILDVLDKFKAKATFFMGGCWVDDNTDMVVKILERGHEMGNHGYFHKDHSKIGEMANREEIVTTENLIRQHSGCKTTLFSPPSGVFSVETLKVAENLGYKTILWSKDTVDWRDKNPRIVYNRATKNICGGDFILMHPKEHTLKALPEILTYYNSIGLTAVTVTQCIGE